MQMPKEDIGKKWETNEKVWDKENQVFLNLRKMEEEVKVKIAS